jgi:hypothetical protein
VQILLTAGAAPQPVAIVPVVVVVQLLRYHLSCAAIGSRGRGAAPGLPCAPAATPLRNSVGPSRGGKRPLAHRRSFIRHRHDRRRLHPDAPRRGLCRLLGNLAGGVRLWAWHDPRVSNRNQGDIVPLRKIAKTNNCYQDLASFYVGNGFDRFSGAQCRDRERHNRQKHHVPTEYAKPHQWSSGRGAGWVRSLPFPVNMVFSTPRSVGSQRCLEKKVGSAFQQAVTTRSQWHGRYINHSTFLRTRVALAAPYRTSASFKSVATALSRSSPRTSLKRILPLLSRTKIVG